jgi:hypothetical protein
MLDQVHFIHKIISGRSIGLPGIRQNFAAKQDLLDHDVGPRAGPRSLETGAQLAAVVPGIP